MIKKQDKEQPTGYKFKYKRLYDLGADRMAVIDMMLTNGDSPQTVVEKIQGDWGECAEVKGPTLDKQLQRYRRVWEVKMLPSTESTNL